MPEPTADSLVSLIRKKERELAQQIRAARREAETMTTRARERAAALKDAAQREGQLEAEAYYRQEIAKAEELAGHLKAMGQEQARLLLEAGRAAIGRAAEAVVDFVLPK